VKVMSNMATFMSCIEVEGDGSYVQSVLGQLRTIQSPRGDTGMILLTEIAQTGKKMYIRPYVPSRRWGQCNATATPDDQRAATLEGTTLPVLDERGHPTLPAWGEPRQSGTGRGSDTVIRYSPSMWSPGSSCPSGPGTAADEMLLHEMVHGLRHMRGRSVMLEQVDANPSMDNYEELVAIVVSNIYRSERGTAQLRRDHHGFNPLTAPLTNPSTFRATYLNHLVNFRIEQRSFVNALAAVRCAFNPLAS